MPVDAGTGFGGSVADDSYQKKYAFAARSLYRKWSALTLAAVPVNAADSPAVPDAYSDLYSLLQDTLDSTLQSAGGATGPCPNFSLELTTANANRGPALLMPQALPGVRATLDAFAAAGIHTVSVAVSYPILYSKFPQSDQYLAFYKAVFDELHSRGFTTIAKMGNVFRDPVFGKLPTAQFFQGFNAQRYVTERREMLKTVLKELRPDYVTIEEEPDTQAMFTHIDFSPGSVVKYINGTLKSVDRGGAKIGAGAGSWSPLTYLQQIADQTHVDYLDIHVYPINRGYLSQNVAQAAQIARNHHKPLVVGEAWLYKSRDNEIGPHGLPFADLMARDGYSFWSPLDSEFIKTMSALGRRSGISIVSLFWINYLYGYVDYTPELDAAPAGQRILKFVQAAVPNLVAKRLSPSGETLKDLATSCSSH